MSKPGFYNDNAYRAYPFMAKTPAMLLAENIYVAGPTLPDEAIVDAGFVMGLDAAYDDKAGRVFLQKVMKQNNNVEFVFAFTGGEINGVLKFVVPVDTTEYSTVTEEAVEAGNCGDEPLWEGFIVIGKLDALLVALEAAGNVIEFKLPQDQVNGRYQIEPVRIQNLNKAYLRSISVGNFSRVKTPPCGQAVTADDRELIVHTPCMQGPIKFMEGYQASITQVSRDNSFVFSAAKTAGLRFSSDPTLCDNRGEIVLYPGEENDKPLIHGQVGDTPPRQSEFLSGGWACNDLIFTLNGLGGSNINIVGGQNIQVGVKTYPDGTQSIELTLSENARGKCNG